ncbi:hypothetical protein JWJ90_04910 [Desulfobulbus rhabdoformis]|uniref:glycoside hydrolase family 3 protein n=1 Tax=Desulfobulbus rhabdoformis TaxID=34032 RepID=UPI00196573FA|nr:glycoside hydrolase family 3 N-terminal domain-containing protein [Desulfobulbus rhabdoformis]MBM9613625.1 hypothetical protein [Desulfobulbus rhabdoformis]
MDLIHNLAQLFLVGFRGVTLSNDNWLTTALRENPPGGVLLFDRNVDGSVQNIESPAQLAKLTTALQERSITPLLIAIDQEGGMVSRLKERDGFSPSFSATDLANKGVGATEKAAISCAVQLAAMGVNLNFAPVVDLDLNLENPIISRYKRSYGPNVAQVVAHARAVIKAHHDHHVHCCLKHFPGHGSAGGDSHLGFVDVSACWQELELAPYRQLIDGGYTDGIMTAHLVNQVLDPKRLPATLSPRIIDGLLRQKLGFGGVVLSDDLQMRAISQGWRLEEAVQLSFLAGVDMLVIGNNLTPQEDALSRGIEAIRALLDSGRIDYNRVDVSLSRIAQMKSTWTSTINGI